MFSRPPWAGGGDDVQVDNEAGGATMEWMFDTGIGRPRRGTGTASSVRIVPYDATHRDAFRVLNEEWLTEYMEIEPEDVRVLSDPEGTILSGGGVILLAVDGAEPVGTGALINEGSGRYELAKMAVTASHRGRGIGRRIAERLIQVARDLGAHEVELVSARLLPAATPLYRTLGFREVPLGANPYTRADIRMTLELRH
ncbi:MAG TPA: GNAT family N-acetyltransferase [Gemmatimonadales bacterium]|nr:GNAT family N-acetyltransferase [Gemmatimonadales bacterium]